MSAPKPLTNVIFRHRRSHIVRAAIAASLITLIGIAAASAFLQYKSAFDRGDIIVIAAVCGGILLLGITLLTMSLIRIVDPVYLEISRTGEGRYRPYFVSKKFHVDPGADLRILGDKIILGDKPGSDQRKGSIDTFSIYLPSSVTLVQGQVDIGSKADRG